MSLLTKIFPTFFIFLTPFILIFLTLQWKMVNAWYSKKEVRSRWLAGLVLTTLIVRIPSTLLNEVTNIDEAQTIAHALTLFRSPIPWVDLDFTTNGPLNAYVFFIPHVLGLPANYLVSHVILIILQIILSWTIYISMRNWFGVNTARVAMIPLLTFLAFAQCPDFLHHSSESWSVVAFGAALAIFSGISKQPLNSRAYHWLSIGFFLGIVPFGKPQGAPPALIAAMAISLFLLFTPGNASFKFRSLGALVSGGLLFPAFILSVVIGTGGWSEFYDLYINANLRYAGMYGQGTGLIPTFLWTWGIAFTASLYLFSILILLPVAMSGGQRKDNHQQLIGIFLAILVYAGAFAVERAGRPFGHYLIVFLFPCLFLLFGWTLYHLKETSKWVVSSVFIILIGANLVLPETAGYYRWFSNKLAAHHKIWQATPTPLAQYVKSVASQPGDCITSYGYYNELYVDTQLPAATRTVTIYQHTRIWPEMYSRFYYADLKKNKPVVFVDALDVPQDLRQYTFANRSEQDPGHFPELTAYLKANYTFVKEIDRGRVYVRNDRL